MSTPELELTIRAADREEGRALAALQLRTALYAYADIFPAQAPPPTLAELAEQWSSWLSPAGPPNRAALVADVDATMVGVVMGGPDPADETLGHLSRLYVEPAQWGRGIGRALHDACLAHLVHHGCARATLWVLERNQRVRSWYERMGWEPTGERKPVYAPGGIDDVGYRLVLPARRGSE